MALQDVYFRIKSAATDLIKGLALPGDAIFGDIDQRVYSQLFPDDSEGRYPRVTLTTEGETEEKLVGDSETERWNYPIRIWIEDKESDRRHSKEELYMTWRKRIMLLFDNRNPFKGVVEEVEGSIIRPGITFNRQLPIYQNIVSGMVLWVSTSEDRY